MFSLGLERTLKVNGQEVNWSEAVVVDRPCTNEEWLRLLTIVVLSPKPLVKIIRVQKRYGGHYVT